jgi:hypothetical protein
VVDRTRVMTRMARSRAFDLHSSPQELSTEATR